MVGTCSIVVETRILANVCYEYPTDGGVSTPSLDER